MRLLELLTEAKQKRACSALIYAEDTEKYLFVRRSRHEDSQTLTWEFPGGKVDDGESWEVALKRELREELNFRQALKGTFSKREWYRKSTDRLEYRSYLVKVKKEFKPQLNKEHDLHRWVKWKKWPTPLRDEVRKTLHEKRWLDRIEDKVEDLTEAEVLELFATIPLNS